MSAKKVFISFRYDDGHKIKEELAKILAENALTIDCSEEQDRGWFSDEQIKRYLYAKLSQTSVTIILLTPNAINHKKMYGKYDDWMYDEIRYSLEDREYNRTNGLIAVYTKEAKDFLIRQSTHTCRICNETKSCTTILQVDNLFRKNMMNVLPEYKTNKCDDLYDSEWDSYCQLVSYEDFIKDVNKYIAIASKKRERCEQYDLVKDLNKRKVGV